MGDTTSRRLGGLYDPVRTHRELSRDSTEQFDAAVYDAHEVEGLSFQAIADAAGCSSSTAHRAFLREAARRQRLVVDDG